MVGLVRALAVIVGAVLALGTLRSAIRSVVLPRSEVVALTRAVFVGLRRVFDVFAKDKRTYEERDRVMAFYAPMGLMLLARDAGTRRRSMISQKAHDAAGIRHQRIVLHHAHDSDPAPTDPISIAREEFDAACREMEEAGVVLKEDLDQAWRDFSGWRVNYDTVLVTLAGFFMAPYAPWSSDRSIRFRVRSRSVAKASNGFQWFIQFVRPSHSSIAPDEQ